MRGNGLPITGNMQLQLPEARIRFAHGLNVLPATAARSYDSLLCNYIYHIAHELTLPPMWQMTEYQRIPVCNVAMLEQNKYWCTSKTSFHWEVKKYFSSHTALNAFNARTFASRTGTQFLNMLLERTIRLKLAHTTALSILCILTSCIQKIMFCVQQACIIQIKRPHPRKHLTN